MTLSELARLLDSLGWASLALSFVSFLAGFYLRRRFLTAVLLFFEFLLGATGVMGIVAIRIALRTSFEDHYPWGFPHLTLFGEGVAAFLFLAPLLTYGATRLAVLLSAPEYRQYELKFWRFLSE